MIGNNYFAVGDKIQLVRKNIIIDAEVVSHDDDSEDYIANVEDWLTVKSKGMTFKLRGRYGAYTFTGKSMRNWGSFRIKKLGNTAGK